MAGSRYRHRPALDGVRGQAMLALMVFHFGLTELVGAWVAVNVFFVLSGFLIIRLLLEERVTYGDIRMVDFYRRRMRRLLPGLCVLLGTLTAYGLLLAPDEVRRPLRADLLATLGYAMNWRLILRDDQYFEQFGNPSFLRHAWTLAVEEQFYLIAPLLVSGLVLLLWRRSHQVAVLLALAALSAAWTAVIGLDTPGAQSHAYYGTDTRVQALLVGAALAFAIGPGRGGGDPRRLPRQVIAGCGWGGLVVMLAGYVLVPPFAPWMFERGGMLLFALAFAALVLACADPRRSLLATILGQRPLAHLGRISYGVYLWHWPVHLWMTRAWPDLPVVVAVLVGSAVTVAIAAASYRFIEQPVLRGGVRALTPRLRSGRLLTGSALVALLVGAMAVGNVSPVRAADLPTPPLVAGTPSYRPGPSVRVALYGDSMADVLGMWMPTQRYPDLRVTNLAEPGCDLVDLPIQWMPGQEQGNTPQCRAAKAGLGEDLRTARADSLVIVAGTLASLPHRSSDGRVVQLSDAGYRQAVVAALGRLKQQADHAGVRSVQIMTVPCREDRVEYFPPQYQPYLRAHPDLVRPSTNPTELNALIRSWARGAGVGVLDLYPVLCAGGFQPERNGIQLYGDQIHFSERATPMIWTWLAPQIQAGAARRTGSTR